MNHDMYWKARRLVASHYSRGMLTHTQLTNGGYEQVSRGSKAVGEVWEAVVLITCPRHAAD